MPNARNGTTKTFGTLVGTKPTTNEINMIGKMQKIRLYFDFTFNAIVVTTISPRIYAKNVAILVVNPGRSCLAISVPKKIMFPVCPAANVPPRSVKVYASIKPPQKVNANANSRNWYKCGRLIFSRYARKILFLS